MVNIYSMRPHFDTHPTNICTNCWKYEIIVEEDEGKNSDGGRMANISIELTQLFLRASSTLHLSRLNTLHESAQRPSWVGSNGGLSYGEIILLIRTMTNVFVCVMQWQFFVVKTFPTVCTIHILALRAEWHCVACVPNGIVLRAFRMALRACVPDGKPCHLRMKSLSDSNSNIRESFRIYLHMEIFIAYQ